MQELLDLRHYIETQQYDKALLLINQLEEMSLEDKLNKISSFIVVLLIHLIKQAAEKRTTRSWDVSIASASFEINKTNKRRKSKGYYASIELLNQLIQEAYPIALKKASLEVNEGKYSESELEQLVNFNTIRDQALLAIAPEKP